MGAISRLVDIANLGTNARDPDFFELLKAAVDAGSMAKGAINLTGTAAAYIGRLHPYWYQTARDTSLDYAIIQLGANIIDQAKIDGYSTRIVFNDGSGTAHEFRGVQNLPYFYRVNSATLKLRMESPVLSATGTYSDVQDEPPALKDPGIGLIMHIPTLWNPHDENAPLGAPGPEGATLPTGVTSPNFRLIADSTVPDQIFANATTTTAAYNDGYNLFWGSGGDNGNSGLEATNKTGSITSASISGTQAALSLYTTGPNGAGSQITPGLGAANSPPLSSQANPLTPSNSQLTFVVPNSTLFREPTVLAMPNVPSGSKLAMVSPASEFTLIQNSAGKVAYSSTGGFISDSGDPLNLPTAPSTTQGYIGICAALYPVEWVGPPEFSGTFGIHHSDIDALNAIGTSGAPGAFVTYRLQYQDPNVNSSAYLSGSATTDSAGWVTYDEKYTQFDCVFLDSAFGLNSGNLADQADGAQGGDWQSYADPRTSRFAALNGADDEPPVQTPGGVGDSQEWADPSNNVSVTDRPDINSGYGISDDRTKNVGVIEFYYLQALGWEIGPGHFRVGLLSQNSSGDPDNAVRFNGDTAKGNPMPSPEGAMYYADPDGVVRGAMGNYQIGSPGDCV
jgi:hypothetical protein